MNRLLLTMVVAVLLACVAVSTKAESVISDSTFNPSDWSTTINYANGGATQTVSQMESGGNHYRYMTHLLPQHEPYSNIGVCHWYLGATYDPSVQGAIDHIDYSEDRIEFDPPFYMAAIGARFVLRQGGVDYYSPAITFANTYWSREELLDLTAADFGSVSHPDFSDNGGPIQFGYFRSNTNKASFAYATYNAIDNWSVTITPVPEPSTFILLGFGALALGLPAFSVARVKGVRVGKRAKG